MDEKYPVVNCIEEMIAKEVDAMIPNNDVNLKTLVKMAKLKEKAPHLIKDEEIAKVVEQVKESNRMYYEMVSQEMALTYDIAGNLVEIENK